MKEVGNRRDNLHPNGSKESGRDVDVDVHGHRENKFFEEKEGKEKDKRVTPLQVPKKGEDLLEKFFESRKFQEELEELDRRKNDV